VTVTVTHGHSARHGEWVGRGGHGHRDSDRVAPEVTDRLGWCGGFGPVPGPPVTVFKFGPPPGPPRRAAAVYCQSTVGAAGRQPRPRPLPIGLHNCQAQPEAASACAGRPGSESAGSGAAYRARAAALRVPPSGPRYSGWWPGIIMIQLEVPSQLQ
jgi:hypothetical protein